MSWGICDRSGLFDRPGAGKGEGVGAELARSKLIVIVVIEISNEDKHQRELMRAIGIDPLVSANLNNTIPSLIRNHQINNLHRSQRGQDILPSCLNKIHWSSDKRLFWIFKNQGISGKHHYLDRKSPGFKEAVLEVLPNAPQIFSSGAILAIFGSLL